MDGHWRQIDRLNFKVSVVSFSFRLLVLGYKESIKFRAASANNRVSSIKILKYVPFSRCIRTPWSGA